jgi:hypothetical protein
VTRRPWLLRAAAALLLGLATQTARAQAPPPQTPFDQGRVRVALSGGSGGTTANRYVVIGAGVGVFVVNGLEVATDVESWLGGDPVITKLSPSLRFIFYMVPTIHPYLGALYRHWFIGNNEDDVDTLGGSLGLIAVLGPGAFAGGGVVHEIIVSSCDRDCSETYPEIFVSLSF